MGERVVTRRTESPAGRVELRHGRTLRMANYTAEHAAVADFRR